MTIFNHRRYLVIKVLTADLRNCQALHLKAGLNLISKPDIFPNHVFPPLPRYWGALISKDKNIFKISLTYLAKAVLLPVSPGCSSERGLRAFQLLLDLLPLNSGTTSHPHHHFCTICVQCLCPGAHRLLFKGLISVLVSIDASSNIICIYSYSWTIKCLLM